MTPEEKILYKNLITSSFLEKKPDGSTKKVGIDTEKWATIPAALRDRAFFSSRVESVRFLATCRERIAELLAAAPNKDGAVTSRAQVVSDIMQAAVNAGIATGKGGLTDPSSPRRATTIIDTNAGLAAAYCRAEVSNSYGARLAFPAQELVRIEQRVNKRDWRLIWRKHGGTLYNNRMIALKGDPIWVKISRFGVPYPPFDFGSGMGVEDVSREDAIALGVIKEDYTPPKSSPITDFNATLEAEMKIAKTNDPLLEALQGVFGDQVKYHPSTKVISWEGNILNQLLKQYTAGDPKGRKSLDLGEISNKLAPMIKTDKKPHLHASGSVLKHIYDKHIVKEADKRGVKMSLSELEFIGRIWREPDTIERGDGTSFVLTQRALDDNIYHLVVTPEVNGGVRLNTLYKKKRLGAEPSTT